MSKPISKPNMAETQHSSNQFVEINRIVSNHILEQLKVELTELKGDTDPKIFLDLSCVNKYYGRGFRLRSYEKIVDRSISFFQEYCTPAWYPNNVIEQSLDVSWYDGSEGNLKLKLPANSSQGKKLRLKGKGIPAKSPGDLYVIINIALPPADTEEAKKVYEQMKNLNFNPRVNFGG